MERAVVLAEWERAARLFGGPDVGNVIPVLYEFCRLRQVQAPQTRRRGQLPQPAPRVTISIRELAVSTGMTRSTVQRAVQSLVDTGLVKRMGRVLLTGVSAACLTMSYKITRKALTWMFKVWDNPSFSENSATERSEIPMPDDVWASRRLGQLGRLLDAVIGDRWMGAGHAADALGVDRSLVLRRLRVLRELGLYEQRGLMWRRVRGQWGDLLRAAARQLGTTGVLAARRSAYDAETQTWISRYEGYRRGRTISGHWVLEVEAA